MHPQLSSIGNLDTVVYPTSNTNFLSQINRYLQLSGQLHQRVLPKLSKAPLSPVVE